MRRAAYDFVIVGGGLQGGLAALALLHRAPKTRIALVEAAARLGGNHTWSFHVADLPPEAASVIEPLIAHRWPGYEVRFPSLLRSFDGGYASILPDRLDAQVRAGLDRSDGSGLFTSSHVREVDADRVVLADGRTLEAHFVLDARGPKLSDGGPDIPPRHAGFQKFLGLELELADAAKIDRPILMDATVPQIDGFRFVYTLPLAPNRLLVEDTYYSDDSVLDRESLHQRVRDYANAQGWRVDRIVRVEAGILPIPWRIRPAPGFGSPLSIGYRGGWFHPTTGYSLPAATRLALALAVDWSSGTRLPGPSLKEWASRHRSQARFCQLLNWMLFSAYSPVDRWRVLARFHRLPAQTVRNFYALELTGMDKLRILSGRPPKGFSIARVFGSVRRPPVTAARTARFSHGGATPRAKAVPSSESHT